MPVEFLCLSRAHLVLFTYSGRVSLQESATAVQAAAQHPDHRAGMRHLCDLSGVTDFERDIPALLKMQAKLVESLHVVAEEMQVLFYAPTAIGQQMAQMARKSWEGLHSVQVMVHPDETEALALLGLKAGSIAALRAHSPA